MTGSTISHYLIGEKLGQGGMGVVYKADALKFLPSHLLGNADIRKRFEREAKAAASLHHPNICPVFEIDEVDNQVFIATAFIAGRSLDKLIAEAPLKLDQARDIAQQIAHGLEAPH
jgi:serine/threonine protein kinase